MCETRELIYLESEFVKNALSKELTQQYKDSNTCSWGETGLKVNESKYFKK